MWKKDKVKKMQFSGNSKANASYTAGEKNNDDQEYYEGKVKDLMECCRNFEKSLKGIKAVNEFTADSIEWRFNYHFGKTMKKMFSKTSRVLKDMNKKLKKLKKKPFIKNGEVDTKLMLDIKDAFRYDAPKGGWNNDTIDRAAIYDKAVYDFFNNEKLPTQLQKVINDLAARALEKTRKESQKNIAVWAGKKLNSIKKQINEMKEKVGDAKKIVDDANNSSGGGASSAKVGNAAAQKDIAEENEYKKKIKELEQQIEKLTAENNLSFEEIIKDENKLNRLRILILNRNKLEDMKAQENLGKGKSGSNSKFKKYDIKKMVLSDLASGVDIVEVNEGDILINGISNAIKARNANKINDLKFGKDVYDVENFIKMCKDSIEKYEKDLDDITNLIGNDSDEKIVRDSIDNLATNIETVWNNVNDAVEKAKKISENAKKAADEANDEQKKRIEQMEEIYNRLQNKVEEFKSNRKEIENYTKRMLVVKKDITVKTIKEYKSVCTSAKRIVVNKEKELKDSPGVNDISEEYKKIEKSIIDMGKAIPEKSRLDKCKAEVDIVLEFINARKTFEEKKNNEELKKKFLKAQEEKDKILNEKTELQNEVKSAVETLRKVVVEASGLVKESKKKFDESIKGKVYPDGKEGQELKVQDENTSKNLGEISKFLDDLGAKLSDKKNSNKPIKVDNYNTAEVVTLLEQLDEVDLNVMREKLLVAAGYDAERLKAYNKANDDKKKSVKDMRTAFENFERAGKDFEKASNEKFTDEEKFGAIVKNYADARDKLYNIQAFEGLKPNQQQQKPLIINGVDLSKKPTLTVPGGGA